MGASAVFSHLSTIIVVTKAAAYTYRESISSSVIVVLADAILAWMVFIANSGKEPHDEFFVHIASEFVLGTSSVLLKAGVACQNCRGIMLRKHHAEKHTHITN